MIRLQKIWFTILALFLISLSQISAQKFEIYYSKFGFGTSLFNLTEYAYDFDYEHANSIYMTLEINNKVRLEPNMGIVFSEGFELTSFGIGIFIKKNLTYDKIYR